MIKSIDKVAEEYAKKFKGRCYRKIRNKVCSRPYTDLELGLEPKPGEREGYAFERLANDKAPGVDWVTGRIMKENKELRENMKVIIRSIFNEEEDVPEYCMEARLMLLSKDGREITSINKSRPIAI